MAGTGTPTKFPTVREFAESQVQKLVENGTITPSSESAQKAPLTPSFSKGTLPLDEQTGQPIPPAEPVPAFTDDARRADLPDGSRVTTSPTGAVTLERPAAPEPEPAAPPAKPPKTPDAPASAPEPEAAATAAEIVAEELADFVFTDPDLGVEIPVKVPKKFLESAKRGYGRRAGYDRAVSYLKSAEPTLKQLIESGQLQAYLPFINAAMTNAEYRDLVAGGYRRLQEGKPLVERAVEEAAAAHVITPSIPSQEMILLESTGDPLLDAISQANRPLRDEILRLRERDEAREAASRRSSEDQQRAAAAQNQRAEQMQAAHADLAAWYPGEFDSSRGPTDPAWQRACEFARDAGYLQRYDLRAAIVLGGQQIVAMELERRAATSSPAAEVVLQTQLGEAAAREAAAAAATVAGGGARATIPSAPPLKPSRWLVEGKTLKPKDQYMTEVAAWHQQYGRLKA